MGWRQAASALVFMLWEGELGGKAWGDTERKGGGDVQFGELDDHSVNDGEECFV